MSSFLNKALRTDANGNGIPDAVEKVLGPDADRNGIPDKADHVLGTSGVNAKSMAISGLMRQQLGGQPINGQQQAGVAAPGQTAGAGGMLGGIINSLGGHQQTQAGTVDGQQPAAGTSGASISQVLHDVANRH